jgi:hypothetical protein
MVFLNPKDEFQKGQPQYHQERHPQGKGNEILLPGARKEGWDTNPIRTRKRLGGLLKYYHKAA